MNDFLIAFKLVFNSKNTYTYSYFKRTDTTTRNWYVQNNYIDNVIKADDLDITPDEARRARRFDDRILDIPSKFLLVTYLYE